MKSLEMLNAFVHGRLPHKFFWMTTKSCCNLKKNQVLHPYKNTPSIMVLNEHKPNKKPNKGS